MLLVSPCRALALAFFSAVLLFAQSGTGELRLTVKDQSGAAVPAAAELVNQSTHTRQSVNLPTSGRYTFKTLPFGAWRLNVSRAGFSPSSELIEIHSVLPLEHNVTLALEGVATTVDVKESETLIDPDRTGSAYYVGSQEVKERETELPGRGLIDLVVQQPGWALEANGVLHPRESEYETQYIINGFPVQDNRSPAFAPNVDADDVQSMKVYTSGIPAEFGQKVGGVIEVTTQRNTSPGFHGTAIAQGGSFDTVGGYLSGQYVAGKTTTTLSTEGFLTERYLDPPVIANYTNHASNGSFNGVFEQDLTDSDRIRVALSRRETHFQVPNEMLQQAAGQREDRQSQETSGQFSYQRVFSPSLLGSFRGMVRDVAADLWSNPLATPIAPRQARGFREGYASVSVAGHHGRHEWKTGGDFRYAALNENFGFHIAAYAVNDIQIYDSGTPADFAFSGRGLDREQSGYAQDLIRLGRFTVSAGIRFDHYSLLVDETAWSPRLGASWTAPVTGTVLHVSYDRTFGTPPFENILVSASAAAQSLNSAGLYLPVKPSRGNYYEAGFTQPLGSHIRLDANYFLRDIRNMQDDDLLENTGVSFPITFARGRIRGIETKLQIPRWGRFSGFLSYANTRGIAEFPIAGGLFLDDGAADLLTSTDRFPISQDQRNIARGMVRYQILPRLWTSWSATYNSGLPTELQDGQSLDFLVSQYGQSVVNSVNFDRGRVHPSFSLDAAVGVDLWQREKRTVTLQGNVINLTDRLNVIDFAGFLSGTAITPPRSFGLKLRAEF
ncbi:MAG TPA: TonB-dependent receptor [Bryobacteraceae bacterium]|nr:TonB-dependent receptor [Bryobacteraceae bacterium]